jgi:hypothetical protein
LKLFPTFFSFSAVVWSVDIRYSAYKAKALVTLEEVNASTGRRLYGRKQALSLSTAVLCEQPYDDCEIKV